MDKYELQTIERRNDLYGEMVKAVTSFLFAYGDKGEEAGMIIDLATEASFRLEEMNAQMKGN